MGDMEDIPFYPWRIRRYPILSICPGDNMEDIPFYRWRIWTISYFIDGRYGRYPILSMENMDDILRSKEKYIIFFSFYRYRRYPRYPILSMEDIEDIQDIQGKKYIIFLILSMGDMEDIPFYPWRIRRYLILSICPGDNMEDILFYRWEIWKISYFIDGRYGRYPKIQGEIYYFFSFYRWEI